MNYGYHESLPMVWFRVRYDKNRLDCKLESQILLHEMREGSRRYQVISPQARKLQHCSLRAELGNSYPIHAWRNRKESNYVPVPDRQPPQMCDLSAFQNGIQKVHHDRRQTVY